MKKIRVVYLVLVIGLLLSGLTGCGSCDHEWKEANCASPKMCTLCGQTEGEATQEHRWEEATTDAPKTCSVCRLTEGDAIFVDDRFHTKDCKALFGSWQMQYETDGSAFAMADMTLPMQVTLTFTNEGELYVKKELINRSQVEAELAERMSQILYDQYSASGMSKEEADAAYKAQNGATISDFCQGRAELILRNMVDEEEMVYYVSDGYLYTGEDWGANMGGDAFEVLKNGKLAFGDPEDEDRPELTRIATVK